MTRRLSRPLRALLLLMVLAIVWAIGFYPYDWSLPLTVHRNAAVHGSDGLELPAPGIAYPQAPPGWMGAVMRGAGLELTLDVEPASPAQNGRLLTVSRDEIERNLTVAQHGDALVILIGRPRTRLKTQFRYAVPQVFTDTDLRRIELAFGGGELRVDVDGRPRLAQRLPRVWARKWDPDYRLAIGNEPTFSRPWLGRMLTARLRVADDDGHIPGNSDDNDGHDLLREALETPRLYVAVREPVRFELVPFTARPLAERQRDVLVNVLGFLPIGFLIVLAGQSRRPVAAACLGCILLSASVEAGQFFLAARVPSSTDLVLNGLGGALGAWIGGRFRSLRVGAREDCLVLSVSGKADSRPKGPGNPPAR